MTPMLEKIARAIAEEDGKRFANHTLYDHNPELFARLSRAALLAMREPDRDMIIAGNDEDGYHNDGSEFTAECSTHWRAMIDAILAQRSTPTDVTPA